MAGPFPSTRPPGRLLGVLLVLPFLPVPEQVGDLAGLGACELGDPAADPQGPADELGEDVGDAVAPEEGVRPEGLHQLLDEHLVAELLDGGGDLRAECVKAFRTEQEAKDFVEERRQASAASWKAKEEYVDRFLEGIPEPPKKQEGVNWYVAWNEYAGRFGHYAKPEHYSSLEEIMQQVRYRLLSEPKSAFEDAPALKGFEPPETICHHNVFVVEIKGAGDGD